MIPGAGAGQGTARRRAVLAALLFAGALVGPDRSDATGEALTNPVLGDPLAIAEGDRLYRSRCVICHGRAGGRGPNLFATRISDEQFLEIVINGRKGTQMPAFGLRMSPDEVWQLHAYVKSRSAAF